MEAISDGACGRRDSSSRGGGPKDASRFDGTALSRRACIFCGRRNQKITGEHLLGQWLTRLAGPGNYLAIRSASDVLRRESETTWQTNKVADLKINDVCSSCNAALGKTVEEPASRVLVPLVQGRASRLSREAQKAISLWLYKVGVLYRYVAQPPREAAREELDDIYIRRSPSLGSRVHVASYAGAFGIKLVSYQVGLVQAASTAEFTKTLKDRTWDRGELVTIAIGRFAAQLALYPPRTNFAYGGGGSVVRQIWRTIEEIDWPPPMFFDDDGLDSFAMTVIP